MKINIEDLIYILDHTPGNQNVLLCGKHGIGKSEIITEYYQKKGMKVVPLFIGQMSDPGDIIGLPNKNEENGSTEFMLPFWFPVDGKPIVLFLDELNRARPELLQVVMDLVLNRKIAGRELPEGSIIVSAINGGDEYTLTDLDPALISRFNVYNFSPEVKEWIQWGLKHGVNDYVIDFIGTHDDMLDFNYVEGKDVQDKTYDRRSWKRLSDILNLYGFDNNPRNRKLICGIIGEIAGAKFFDYILNGTMIKSEELLTDFDSVKTKMSNYSIIKIMTLCDRVCGFINNNSEFVNKVEVVENFGKFVNYLIDNNREGMSYLTSNYADGLFPNFNIFIGKNYQLDTLFEQFISSIEFK